MDVKWPPPVTGPTTFPCNPNMKRFLAGAMLLLAACTDSTGPAARSALMPPGPSLDKIVNTRAPQSFSLLNPCNGEGVSLQGVTHVQLNVTTTRSGNTTIRQQTTSHLSGVGLTSGARYTSTLRSGISDHAQDPFPLVSAFTLSGRMTAQGSAPNFYYRVYVRVVYNNSGEPTAEIVKIDTKCETPF